MAEPIGITGPLEALALHGLTLAIVVLSGAASKPMQQKHLATQATRPDLSDRLQCKYGPWSAPDTVRTSGGGYAHIEAPTILPRDNSIILLGAPASEYVRNKAPKPGMRQTFNRPRDILGVSLQTATTWRTIPLPPDAPELTFVRAARTSDGKIHAVWLGRPKGNGRDSLLWTAEFVHRNWSEPFTLSPSPGYRWNSDFPSELRTSKDRLEIVIPALDSVSGYSMDHIEWQDNDVHRVRYSTDPSLYLTTLPTSRGTLLGFVATIKSAPTGKGDNSVFVATLPLRGKRLPLEARLISPSNGGAAYDLRLLKGPRTSSYLLWRYRSPGARFADSIQLAVSNDAGKKWQLTRGLFVPGGVERASGVVAADGGLLLVFRQPRVGGTVTSVEWRNGVWAVPTTMPSKAISMPVTGLLPRGKQVLVWGVWGPSVTQFFPVTLVSRRDLRCDGGTT